MAGVFFTLILPGVEDIERRSCFVDLMRVEQAIQQELRRIQQSSREWGQWDDSYHYAATLNPDYEANNLTVNWLTDLKLNLLAIVGADGQLLVSRFSHPEHTLTEPLVMETLGATDVESRLRDGGIGLVKSPAGVLLLASSRILPTKGQGPSRGTFYFGRLIDDDFIRELSEQLHLPVRLISEKPALPELRFEALSENQSLSQMGVPLLNAGGDDLYIHLQQERPYYQQMLASARYYMAAIFLAGLFASLVAYIFLQHVLVRPILVLKAEAERFSDAHKSIYFKHSTTQDEIGQLAHAFEEMAERVIEGRLLLERERKKFEHDSLTDPLTGLGNRRYQEQALAMDRESHSGASRLFIMIDLDHFKQVNDRYGHDVGDGVLQQMAKLLEQCSRGQDILARSGGEEFSLFCAGIDAGSASSIAKRICQETAAHLFGDQDIRLHLTCSVGFALCPQCGADTQNAECDARLLKLADLALYQAKAQGRNTWVGYRLQPEISDCRVPVSEAALHDAVITGAVVSFGPESGNWVTVP